MWVGLGRIRFGMKGRVRRVYTTWVDMCAGRYMA